MLYTTSIFWEHDSNELLDLPHANVMTCGSDGMEVIGTREEIEYLAEFVEEHPTLRHEGVEQADEVDIRIALEFANANFPRGEGYDRISLYEKLGHKTSDYYYILAETPHGTRYWTVVGDKGEVDSAEQQHVYRFEAHDHDHAVALVEANGDPEAWVSEGEVIWLDIHWKPL